MNFLKRRNTFVNNLPDRDIELVTFDSPKLKKTTVRAFNYWLDQPENGELAKRISIEQYVSRDDPVPHLGEVPLGWKGNTEALKKYAFSILSPKNCNNPEMKLHPHDRRYFSTRPNIDFNELHIHIDKYHPREWTVLELIRRLVGFFLFPVILIFGFLKRFLFGWRGAIPRVAKILHKAIPQKPLSGTA
jgi:hypothetical protein